MLKKNNLYNHLEFNDLNFGNGFYSIIFRYEFIRYLGSAIAVTEEGAIFMYWIKAFRHGPTAYDCWVMQY